MVKTSFQMTDLETDITKLFNHLNRVEAAIFECVTPNNLSYVMVVGWIQNCVLLKIDTEIRIIIDQYQMKDNDIAMKKVVWLLQKNNLYVKTIIHIFNNDTKELMAELYNVEKQKTAILISTKTGAQEVTYSYSLLLKEFDAQNMVNEYNGFLRMLKEHQPPLRIIKASPDPKVLSRKQKIKNSELN